MQSLLQTKKWATLRQGFGWQAYNVDDIWVLERQLPMGKSFLYAPEVGFDKAKGHPEALLKDLSRMRDAASAADSSLIAQNDLKNSIFFRLEILNEYDDQIIVELKKAGFVKAFEEVQPEWRQVVDISKEEEEILAQMKEKGRYNIRIAQRNGVIVKVADDPSTSLRVEKFYRIFQETAERDGFSIRPLSYFQKMFEILGDSVELLTAEFQGNIIAAEIVSYYSDTASYLYGASSNDFRNVMAPYLLHWEAMKRAKARNCKFYDLLAVAPLENIDSSRPSGSNNNILRGEVEKFADNHKYVGITRFKRQFGGRTVHIVGSYDYVYKPVWYKAFKIAEKIRRK